VSSEEEQENFIIVKNIGSNNICHCYLIRSTVTNEEFVYKKINTSDANDASVKKIKNEMEILKTLNHPNIILFINAFFSNDQKTLFLFTEYADDGNLQMKLDENKKKKEYLKV
jgi:serine/threonine protein kinase